MVTLFIQKEPKINLLTLRAITSKDKIHSLIEKKEWKTTLISEEKTCYLYVNKDSEDYNFHSFHNYFANFSSNSERSWNIDLQSFVSKNLGEEELIQAISEGILFGSHQSIKFKQKEDKKRVAIIIC